MYIDIVNQFFISPLIGYKKENGKHRVIVGLLIENRPDPEMTTRLNTWPV